EAAGATATDIVKTNTYIVNYKQADYSALREARAELFPSGEPPASTLVGVTSLAVDGLLVEMEAIALAKWPLSAALGRAGSRALIRRRSAFPSPLPAC